jgi:serine/threonine protein kinase
MINNYYIKYLKYKEKYINLKKQNGGNSQIVNNDIIESIHTLQFNPKSSLINRNLIIQNNDKIIEYRIINFLGSGSYGEVYKIRSSEGEDFVIKIGFEDEEDEEDFDDDLLDEVKILERLMIGVLPQCNYTSILSGIQKISISSETYNVYHIIFPFKGNNNMKVVLDRTENIHLIPSLLNDIITCLKEINKRGFHGDLKLDNIVVNDSNNAFIIDYGLGKIYDTFDFGDIKFLSDSDTKFILGNQQKSIDNIISYKLVKKGKQSILNKLYDEHKGKILQTIDNFGLFWLIIKCFYNNLIDNYIKSKLYFTMKSDDNIHNEYINLYFNLNPPSTPMEIELATILSFVPQLNFREQFIDVIKRKLESEHKFKLIFKNPDESEANSKYNAFMNLILNLITIDPARRMPIQALLLDEFFI